MLIYLVVAVETLVLKMSFIEYASRISKIVDEFIMNTIRGVPSTLYEAALHYLRAGGKRLRPLITVLGARIVGGDEDIAIPGAAGVEVLHTFTLIHDDIIDKDELRRGVPTVHKIWGSDMAIVAGDLLYAYSYRCLLRALERGVPVERVNKAIDILTDAAITVAEGQALDMLLPSMQSVSINDYIEMVKKKTAALFASSIAIGATLAGGDEKLIAMLRESMINAGIAFQIRDDILGLIGDEKTLGKPIYSDLREGKMTILVIYTYSKIDDESRARMRRVLGNRNASLEDLQDVANIIRNSGAIEYADSLAEEYALKAIRLSEKIESRDNEALQMFRDVIKFMVKRNY